MGTEKIKYNILKELNEGNSTLSANDLGIDLENFGKIVEEIEGHLIRGSEVNRMGLGNKVGNVWLRDCVITPAGMNILSNH